MENDDAKRPQEKEEEEDRRAALTLALFDLYWFHSLILFHLPPPPPPPLPPPLPPAAADSESCTSSPTPASLLLRRLRHRRSLSDDLSPSPILQIHPPKLKTILSGKEPAPDGDDDEIPMFEVTVEEHEQRWRKRRDRRRRRRRRIESSKSLSELEFEELKGFMDLGFTFSDVEADPRLMEIVPGLQRLKAAGDKEPPVATSEAAGDEGASSCVSADDVAVSRPYLSEAWDAVEEEEEEEVNRLRNFKIPMAEDGVDLKDQLRFWAHAVASTVR